MHFTEHPETKRPENSRHGADGAWFRFRRRNGPAKNSYAAMGELELCGLGFVTDRLDGIHLLRSC